MCFSRLVVIGLIVLGVGAAQASDDPEALIKRLGADRFNDREEASRALEALGKSALPALKAARSAKDAEIKSRAQALITRIESKLMVRPTLVRLDFHEAPLPRVLEELSARSGVPMMLIPENSPVWKDRTVTLEAATPVSFWEMLDRLAEAAQLQYTVGAGVPPNGRGGQVQLFARAPGTIALPPRYDSGPFRVSVQGLHLHRDLSYGPVGMVPAPAAFVGNAVPPRPVPANRQPTVTVQFTVDLQVVAEPRMVITQSGPLDLAEAVDDEGRSLLPPGSAEARQRQRFSGFFGAFGAGMTTITASAQLLPPAKSSEIVIKRLRGSVPILVAARKEDAVTVPLAESKGKTITSGDLSVTIHDVHPDPNQGGATAVDVSITPNSTGDPTADVNQLRLEAFAFRSPQMAQNQVEILDAQGRAYTRWTTSSMAMNGAEARLTMQFVPDAQVGPPTQIRLYDLARTTAEAEFEFRDLRIP